ncbi:MAG: hypothetical protein Terrestrivirus2_198 [Terrestrivirus sp.]|uniref:Uncharacterized protein n=1 Tax=Terrestrivirus sp. TaxID=2487775 RepID=A0A3G4ZLF9_9VIRU|nr:MAG: hypothetical protein Terrestrivirus2_198 [Terrestrivirus sp.]
MKSDKKTVKIVKSESNQNGMNSNAAIFGYQVPFWLIIVILIIILLLVADYCKWINLGITGQSEKIKLPSNLVQTPEVVSPAETALVDVGSVGNQRY